MATREKVKTFTFSPTWLPSQHFAAGQTPVLATSPRRQKFVRDILSHNIITHFFQLVQAILQSAGALILPHQSKNEYAGRGACEACD